MNIKYVINQHTSEQTNNSQAVNFFYSIGKNISIQETMGESFPPNVYEGAAIFTENELPYPVKQTYLDLLNNEKNTNANIILMNYTSEGVVGYPAGLSDIAANFTSIDIYKREIWDGGGETTYTPVAINFRNSVLIDYNIANNRYYEYIAYPTGTDAEGATLSDAVQVSWPTWSLTELHPVENSTTEFTASPQDVWLFKFNVSMGEQTQNLSKTQQDNLTAYPVFSHGLKNNISSSVTCLLGSEMVPYDYITQKRVYNPRLGRWETITVPDEVTGGYIERLRYGGDNPTSNEQVDMLNAWRQIAYSGNPKLLKDLKGQKFLVQIESSSATIEETWNHKPVSITFSWVEIGSLDGVIITNGDA